MNLTLHQFDLRLKNTFRIAHSARDVQETLVVALEHECITRIRGSHSKHLLPCAKHGEKAVFEHFLDLTFPLSN